MTGQNVTKLADLPPRITDLGNKVIAEIAERCGVEKKVVLRAMMITSLERQKDLVRNIDKLRGHESEIETYRP